MTSLFNKLLPAPLAKKLEGRQSLREIIDNTGWLFLDKILRMGVGIIVSIWVIRYLGPDRFGQLSYATAFVGLFSAFASLGLDGIVVRELVRKPEDAPEILGSSFFLRIGGGAATLLISSLAILLLRHDEPQSLLLVAILASGTIFQAFDVIDFWFQSQVQSRYTVLARNSAFLTISCIKIGLILGHASLVMFAWAALAEIILAATGLGIAYRKSGHSIRAWRGTVNRCTALLSDSWPIILSGLSVAVYMKIDQIMLGEMIDNGAVGIYTSATKLSEIWYMIPMIIVSSIFPALIQSREKDEALYYRRITRLFSLMAAISLMIALPMSLCSTWLVVALYGSHYQAAGPVLAVHIWSSLFVFYGVAQSPWDLTENLNRLAMIRIILGATANVLLNLVLIPSYGVLGAAIATVLSQSLAAMFLNLIHEKTRPIFFCQLRSLLFLKYLRGL